MQQFLILTFMLACAALCDSIPVFFKPTGADIPLLTGYVEYDVLNSEASYNPVADIPTSSGCFMLEESGKCLSYVAQSENPHSKVDFHLFYNADRAASHSVYQVDAIRSNAAGPARVTLQGSAVGPTPQWKTAPKLDWANQIREPEPEKTFWQKYWIYIIPIGLMVVAQSAGAR